MSENGIAAAAHPRRHSRSPSPTTVGAKPRRDIVGAALAEAGAEDLVMLASAARETGPALGHTPAEASLRRPARRLRRARTRTTEARPKRPFRSRRRCRVVKISGGSPNALRSEVGPGTGTWSSRSSGSPRLPALSATFYCRRSLVMGRTAYLLAAEGLCARDEIGPIPVSILASARSDRSAAADGHEPLRPRVSLAAGAEHEF
jgi:hypothetical protein